ncbi:transcription termination factor NusA [Abiotrophia sp.]|jgi:transcription termination factor nusA|uniref:transcription termination factor NusA n=1 Tax=Abiotrophia sp. TaxID=76631 RepID=UPI001CB09FE8|nr:transcription termination factor NusA [Abiotrophia sp.]MBF0937046.1 transcription termination/antitermination protein NusA [Abiotrophia sp.]
MSKELVKAMQVLEEEKGISRQVIKEALESALALAYKKNYDQAQNVEVQFDENKGTIKVYSVKEVVETNYDSTLEISLEEALKINRAYEIGDKIKFEVTPKDFGRIATQTAKHVIMQRIREAERENIFEEFSQYVDEIMTGTVERQDHRFIYVNIGRVEAIMPLGEQIPSEQFEPDQRIKVYVAKVDKTSKGPQIVVSRAHNDFLRRLFEQEVPEIYDGTVEVMAIAREAGDRAKVAVRSRDKNIDPVGTCVGPRGQRVQAIVNELNGENMDIIEWNEDPVVFIQNALSPAQVLKVDFNEEAHACIVVVPDNQLSLAIGKRGQNARLAARLTTYKIDIKSESSYADYLEEQAALAIEAQAAAEASQEDLAEELPAETLDQAVEVEDLKLESEPAGEE